MKLRLVLTLALAACGGAGPVATSTTTSDPGTTSQTTSSQVSTEKLLRISVWDDTSDWAAASRTGLPDIEVWVRGTGSWFPDTSFGGDVLEEAGPFPVGEVSYLHIFPDGRGGKEFVVELLVGDEVIALRDTISITIDDTTVNVFGTPVQGFEVEFTR